MGKIKDRIGNIKENFAKKTIRQKIRICIGLTLLLIFLFFVIKGNFFDTRTTAPPLDTSQSTESGESSDNPQEEQDAQRSNKKVRFKINWIDVGIFAALCTAYGVHKYRERNRERR